MFETNYLAIKRKAAVRLAADLNQFVKKYDAEMTDVDADTDEFRVLICASHAIERMIENLKKPTVEERLDEIEARLVF